MKGWLFIALLAVGSLFALTGLRVFFVEPLASPGPNLVWFILQILPLLLPLPGVLRGQIRATFILCLVSLLYFIHGVLLAYEGTLQWLGAWEIGFSLLLCGTTTLLVRKLREREATKQAEL